MKSFIFVFCIFLIFSLQLSVASSRAIQKKPAKKVKFNGDIDLPELINLNARDENTIRVSKAEYVYDKDGKMLESEFTYDIELKECKLNKYSKKISCSFLDNDDKKSVILETKFKDSCKLSKDTKLVNGDLYALNTKNKFGKYSNIIHYEIVNDEIDTVFLTAQKFEFTTKDDCTFTVNVTKADIY